MIGDSYDTADSVKHWKYNRIRDWAEKKPALAAAAGWCTFGDRKIKCIQGFLSYWCTKTSLMDMGLTNIVNAFDIAVMNDSIIEAELEYEEDSKKDSDIINPEKFSYEKWNQWEESVYCATISWPRRIVWGYLMHMSFIRIHALLTQVR